MRLLTPEQKKVLAKIAVPDAKPEPQAQKQEQKMPPMLDISNGGGNELDNGCCTDRPPLPINN